MTADPNTLMLLMGLAGGLGLAILAGQMRLQRMNRESGLTEATRYFWDLMRDIPDTPLSADQLSLSLSLGQEEPPGSSCPIFQAYLVFGGGASSATD